MDESREKQQAYSSLGTSVREDRESGGGPGEVEVLKSFKL